MTARPSARSTARASRSSHSPKRSARTAPRTAPVASLPSEASPATMGGVSEAAARDFAARPSVTMIDVTLELSEDALRDLEARAAKANVDRQILASAYVLFMLGYKPDGSRQNPIVDREGRVSTGAHAALDLIDSTAARMAYPDEHAAK